MANQTPPPMQLTRGEHLFVIRIWFETSRTLNPPMRGFVEHISSGQRFYFVTYTDLIEFVRDKAAPNQIPGAAEKGEE